MTYWELFLIAGIAFLIIEMFTPVLFFFNLAIAGFVTAIFAYFIKDLYILVPIFVVFSAVFLLFLRPLIVNRKNDKKAEVKEAYIGKIAKVTEDISKNSGVITIYNERWEARCESDEIIPAGSEVKIVRNDSLILFVEKA